MIVAATALWVAVAAAIAFIYYVRLVEPRRLQLTEVEVPIEHLPEALDGLTIAQISDLHYRPAADRERLCRQAVDLANAARTDLIVLTGDLADGYDVLEPCLEHLKALSAPLGVWAVLGNHDHYCLRGGIFRVTRPPSERERREALAAAGIKLLINEATRLEIGGGSLALVGVDDASSGRDDLPAALASAERADLVVLLSHSPDILDDPAADAADLVLCGHTHGGQITLPGVGSPWAPVWRDRRRCSGLMRAGRALCYVSRGVSSASQARFRCRPEVAVLTLQKGAPEGVRSVRVRRMSNEQPAVVEEVSS